MPPPTPHNLIFLGSGAFGLPTLKHLAQHHNLLAVVSQPDKPAGRNRKLTPTPIAAWAQDNLPNTPIIKPEDINAPQHVERIHALLDKGEGGAAIVIAFGQKLGPELTRAPGNGARGWHPGETGGWANLHASLLPRWRGAAPIVRAMLAHDPLAGNSVITIADRMDAGLVLATTPPERQISTAPPRTAGELHDQLAAEGPTLIQEVLDNHASGTLNPQTQDESLVTRAKKLAKSDGHADFNHPAEHVARTINALNPWPAVTAHFRDQPTKLLRAEVAPSFDPQDLNPPPVHLGEVPRSGGGGVGAADDSTTNEPGSILNPQLGTIACTKNTAIRILELQPAGKKPMTWQAFANGLTPTTADRFVTPAESNSEHPPPNK